MGGSTFTLPAPKISRAAPLNWAIVNGESKPEIPLCASTRDDSRSVAAAGIGDWRERDDARACLMAFGRDDMPMAETCVDLPMESSCRAKNHAEATGAHP
jgi:hypothetical protein